MFKNMCWVNGLFTLMVLILAIVSISSFIAGCGNKGDLYLPENASSPQTTPEKKN